MDSSPAWITPNVKQVWVAVSIFMMKINIGMSLGFTSCFLMAIKAPDSPIQMDLHTSSWFVSSYPVFLLMGIILATPFLPKFGRKMSLKINCVPAIIAILIYPFAADASSVLVARALSGITAGCITVTGSTIIVEYSSPRNRGMFLNALTAMLNIGSLIIHVVGNYIHWRVLGILSNIPLIITLIIAYTIPESPFWLAERKQYEKSREAFYWLRGRTEDSIREIEELIRAQRYKIIDKPFLEQVLNFFLKFKMKNFLKPLFVVFLTTVLIEASGRHVFPSYAAQLVSEITAGGFDPFYFNIVLDLVISASGFTAAYLIRVMTTRALLFSTGAATFVLLCLTSLSLYLGSTGALPADYSWVTLVLCTVFFIFTNLGCTCVPHMLQGEIFPREHRVVGLLMGGFLASLSMMAALKLMPLMVHAFDIHGAFGILAMTLGVVLLVLYFITPDTSNKTLMEIEKYYNDETSRDGYEVPPENVDDEDVKKRNAVCCG